MDKYTRTTGNYVADGDDGYKEEPELQDVWCYGCNKPHNDYDISLGHFVEVTIGGIQKEFYCDLFTIADIQNDYKKQSEAYGEIKYKIIT